MNELFKDILNASIIRNENAKIALQLGIISRDEYREKLEPIIDEEVKRLEEILKCH